MFVLIRNNHKYILAVNPEILRLCCLIVEKMYEHYYYHSYSVLYERP